jgi:hypothetical protein
MALLSLSFSPFSDTEGRTLPPLADAASGRESTGDPNITPGDDFCGFVARLLTLARCRGADRRAQAVLALERAIAETHGQRLYLDPGARVRLW